LCPGFRNGEVESGGNQGSENEQASRHGHGLTFLALVNFEEGGRIAVPPYDFILPLRLSQRQFLKLGDPHSMIAENHGFISRALLNMENPWWARG